MKKGFNGYSEINAICFIQGGRNYRVKTIYIKIGSAAVLNQGIRLNSNGGSYEMSKELGNLSTAAINAISTSGSKNIIVTEFV